MNHASSAGSGPELAGTRVRWVSTGAEMLLAGMALFATDALAHRKLSVAGFLLLVTGWIVALLTVAAWRRLRPTATLGPGAIELVLPALWLAASSPLLKQPWTAPQILHVTGLVAVMWWLWRKLAVGPGECLRLLLVGVTALLVTAPYFTDLHVGGQDARWYASVYIDFLQQLRAGVFPVFVGQGEFSFNGSVNLFRSAPLCLWIGGLWDWLTWHSLSPLAVRNLAIISAALGTGGGLYAVLLQLVHSQSAVREQSFGRWLAAGGAVLFLLCPAVLQCLYFYELQMTWTALAALPWVFWGNLRPMLDPQGRGYGVLAVGLSLVWLAHAPLAILATTGTAVMQMGRFLVEPGTIARQGWSAAKGALLFGLLSAFYFAGMSELPALGGPGLGRTVGTLLGVGVVLTGGIWAVSGWRRIWAVGCSILGVGLLALGGSAWLPWALVWLVVFWLAVAAMTRWGRQAPEPAQLVLTAGTVMAVAAAIIHPWVTAAGHVPHEGMQKALAEFSNLRWAFLLPVTMAPPGMVQPGHASWLLGLLALAAAPWLRSVALSLLVTFIVFFVLVIMHVPGVSDFLVGHAPTVFGDVANFPMLYRVVPLLALWMIMAGLFVVARMTSGPTVSALVLGVLLLGVAWSAWEAKPILSRGWALRTDRKTTERLFHPDNYALSRYAYVMLTRPLHFADGRQTPWMMSRLLGRETELLVGPEEVARTAEAIQVDTRLLTSRVDDLNPHWLVLGPAWEVQPGETRMLRFEFDADKNCAGWLILGSTHGYQEHLLDPAAGGTGFGAGPVASRVLAVTNSGPRTEYYTMRLKMEPGNTLPRDGGAWGRVHFSRYYPDLSPVRVKSLRPYRALVTMPADGFLETPRQWAPGYRVWVDGRRVEPERLFSGMLGVRLPAGQHTVVVDFVGSLRLWTGLLVSAGTLAGLLAWQFSRTPVRREAWRKGWHSWIEANRN